MPPIIMATECSEELRCALCLDSWQDPVELVPCGHIFCTKCVKGVYTCPICREPVTGSKRPNRVLVNLALAVPVKCSACGWTGTREGGSSHTCSAGTDVTAVPAASAAGPKYAVMEPTGQDPWRQFGLSREEYDQIMALFVFFDADDSGGLDRSEVGRLARWLNFARSEYDIDRMFREMDADRSGTLSLNEFLAWLSHNRPDPNALYGLSQSEYNTIMMQFRMYDKDQDGLLSMDEFARLALGVGDVGDVDAGRRLFRSIDANGSGVVDLHRFLTYRIRMRYS
ncbi:EF hand [Trypanosoma conorhini]|uniref:EF hand n=1 Tax=Trypanosoma conorhini TaxID=83891 RepID=A0A3R7JWQ7_9TRYP|nr:EF hand [Trypanosoma conorhini]RNE98043.1 EF hand [Trypanosoma conorhini]